MTTIDENGRTANRRAKHHEALAALWHWLDSDDPKTKTIPESIRDGLHQDWGQNYILAAEID